LENLQQSFIYDLENWVIDKLGEVFVETTKDKIGELALYESAKVKMMPVEIFDVDDFIEIAERAEYCSIKRLERVVKLKLRTPRKLFTLKVNPINAEEIVKKLRCEIREI
jgi:hypothetical protein